MRSRICGSSRLTFPFASSRKVQVFTPLLSVYLPISESSWSRDLISDIADLDGGSVAEITFPNPNNLTSFKVKVRITLNGRLYSFDR